MVQDKITFSIYSWCIHAHSAIRSSLTLNLWILPMCGAILRWWSHICSIAFRSRDYFLVGQPVHYNTRDMWTIIVLHATEVFTKSTWTKNELKNIIQILLSSQKPIWKKWARFYHQAWFHPIPLQNHLCVLPGRASNVPHFQIVFTLLSGWNSNLDSSMNKTVAQSFSSQLWKIRHSLDLALRLPLERDGRRKLQLASWRRFLTVSRLMIKLCAARNSVTNSGAVIVGCLLALKIKNLTWAAVVQCPYSQCC